MLTVLIVWIVIGIIVVKFFEHGAIAMVAHNYPWLGILMLLFVWVFWPLVLYQAFYTWKNERHLGKKR
jgi:uncharacterized membrane protein YkvI